MKSLALATFLLLALAQSALAQVPAILHYQGRILADGVAYQGAGQFKFALVNETASEIYWRNAPDANNDGQPDSAVSATVTRGLYSILLGNTTLPNMAALPPEAFANSSVFLRVWFSDGVAPFELITPDQRIAAVGYALVAGTVSDGAVTLQKLGTDARDAIQSALDQATALDTRLDSAESQIATLSTQAGAFDTRIGALETTSATALVEIAALTAGGVLTSNRVTTISNEVVAVNARIDALPAPQAAPPGLTAVSDSLTDSALLALGFVPFTSTTAAPWVNGSVVNAPSARSGHAEIWTGSSWIIWGGNRGGGVLDDTGAIYTPETDSWSPTVAFGRPSLRTGHTAVWTGQQMLVWGGISAGVYLDAGGKLTASPQEWSTITTTGAPPGRMGHVAIWTGSRMLIWGGRNDSGLLNDGALYDPIANQWESLTLPSAPAARQDAAYAWTGDRLIIWGGSGEAGSLASGAQLLFANGQPSSWTPIATALAPSARIGHTLVWTGQKAIVWGGRDGAPLNDGAAYDPIANEWQTLSASQAPTARSDHNALWTGTEMLILNGDSGAGAIAGVSAYNPAADRWRTLQNAAAARAREEATAAWTGSEALIFGGLSAGSPLAVLQRVNPAPPWTFYRKP
jgi:hypothetical protein